MKMLKCERPNGEELVIPRPPDRAEIARSFSYTSAKGKWTFDPETGGLKDYVETKRENQSAYIIIDDIPGGLRCMACRSVHTSKAMFRECYKRHGMIEVGNESLEIKPDKDDEKRYEAQLEDDIAWAFNALKYDEAPMDELTRERCKIIDKQVRDSGDTRLRSNDGKLLIDGRE